MGMAASMGQFLLTAGAKGEALHHAAFACADASAVWWRAGGTATDIRINADLILGMKQELSEITAANTGKTVEQIIEDSDRDRWFTAQEALEYGFVDHIITNSHAVLGSGRGELNMTGAAKQPKTLIGDS